MSRDPRITELIPHREPFLWVDRIIATGKKVIVTEKDIPEDLDIFVGHYPGHPIFPGVLLCEAVFQTSGLLMAQIESEKQQEGAKRLPVITRIGSARFKRAVLPGDTIRIEVELKETVSAASFFKGTVLVNGKTALRIDFAATSVVSKPTIHQWPET
jgi:3-hydroxyacyl-[acyl-carrier-protein] dehydratase